MPRKKQNPGKGQGKKKAPKKAPVKAKAKAVKTQKAKRPAPKKARPQHWLVRPETIRRLWIGGLFALAGLVAVEAWVYTHGYFGIDGIFAFNAWFGFASCVAMILISNGLGKLLKREDTYYDLD